MRHAGHQRPELDLLSGATMSNPGAHTAAFFEAAYLRDRLANPSKIAIAAKPAPLYASQIVGSVPAQTVAGHTATVATPFMAAAGSTALGTSVPGSLLSINISWDSSVQSAPVAFKADVIAAVNYYESMFSLPATLNLAVGYGEINGTALSANDLGESEGELLTMSYAQLVAALQANNSNATDASVLASLPKTSPVSGGYVITTAEAKALGLLAGANAALDGYVGFDISSAFSYNDSTGVTAGKYDFMSVALHEISEVMGRYVLAGATLGTNTHYYGILDLLHYAATDVHDFTQSTPGYFSANGGVTNLGNFNTIAGGDPGDWASSVADNSYDAYSSSGTVNVVSNSDLTLMNAIGWDLNGPGIAATATGIASASATTALAKLQGTSALTANTALATFTETGDYAWDSYKFALGGSGATSFALSTADDLATLSTSAAGANGAVNGALYALHLTATDTTTGNTSPQLPLDIIAGSSGTDTISLAKLLGAGSTVPAFVFGLAGNDTINGSGVSGALSIDGGGGADTLTGGTGVNNYLYGAASDSTPAAMDVITNFNVASNIINLAGLGIKLAYDGLITGATIAADSVGWLHSGGNTYVGADTSGAAEGVNSTNVRIELTGSLSLSSSNIVHV